MNRLLYNFNSLLLWRIKWGLPLIFCSEKDKIALVEAIKYEEPPIY